MCTRPLIMLRRSEAGLSLVEVLVAVAILGILAAVVTTAVGNMHFGTAKANAKRSSQSAFTLLDALVTKQIQNMVDLGGDCSAFQTVINSYNVAGGGAVRVRRQALTLPSLTNIPSAHRAAALACDVDDGIAADRTRLRYCVEFAPSASNKGRGSTFTNLYSFAHVYVEFVDLRYNTPMTCPQIYQSSRPWNPVLQIGGNGVGVAAVFADLYAAGRSAKGPVYTRQSHTTYLPIAP